MLNGLTIDPRILSFVDAGSEQLRNHSFASDELNRKKTSHLMKLAVGGVDADDEGPDKEKGVQYRLNQTGNIFYSTTSETLEGATKDLFDSVTVLFAAMTTALSKNNKDLFDYDAWSKIVSMSGFFVEVQKLEKTLSITSNSLTLDTQIVQQLIPGLTSGSSLEIAKSVLSALDGKYSAETADDTTKFGHILFICEELFGAPSVTVRIFFASKASHSTITSSPCHQTVSKSFEQKQEANTFLFVSPDTIAKFAGKFSDRPEEFTNLIDQLSGYIAPVAPAENPPQ